VPIPERVIWITTDHMRFDCIGAYDNDAIHTPNLDRLAEHGVNLLNCYAQNPVCMPSRASFMTGLYPQQTGVTTNGQCLPPAFEPTAATVFKAAGYQTAQIGKLHLQPHDDHDLDPRPRHAYGFDTFLLSEARGCYQDAWLTWLAGRYPEHLDTFRVSRATDPQRWRQEKQGIVLDAPWQASHSGFVAETACRYLRGHGRSRHFLHLGFHNPHPPLNPTREAFAPYEGADIPRPRLGEAEWADKPEPLRRILQGRRDWSESDFLSYRRYFYALVTEVDLALGMLLEFLQQNEWIENTLIAFSSDHGDMCGDHSITHKGPQFYDEVMHVPQILYWPDGLGTQRRDISALIEMVDVLPTLIELCGGYVPEVMSGQSFAPALLSGEEIVGRRDALAFNEPDWIMLCSRNCKYIRYDSTGGEVLYDLSEDPHEVINRAADLAYVDLLHEARLRTLSRALQASRSPLRRSHPW
jgi:arylsulfatase A-like enzyme